MMNLYSIKNVIVLNVLICLSVSSFGQNECNISIADLTREYNIGKFSSVNETLRNYLKVCKNPELAIKRDVYRLLAMNSIAMDSMEQAEKDIEELLKIDRNYSKRSEDPIVFTNLVNIIKTGSEGKVTSVSKIAENLKEAPANILVVTGKDIRERGYKDLEEIYHDLPGFDISRTSGGSYSSIYQRGYRTNNNNDRSLFLIDGMEDNNIWNNAIWLTRQYSLSNIKQIEVIHGPASTMYGANAFAGVSNIITLTPDDLIPSLEENFGFTGFFGLGSFNTKTADITMAFRKNKLSAIVTARFYDSDEFDRSGYDDFDYKYTPQSISDYRGLKMKIDPTVGETDYVGINNSENYAYYTPLGAEKARYLDSLGYVTDSPYKNIAYSNQTKDRYILAKILYGNFVFGIQYWNKEEGLAWFNDSNNAGTANGNIWGPIQVLYYLKYDKNLNDKWSLSNLAFYREHSLSENTALTTKPVSYFSLGKPKGTEIFGTGYRELVAEEVPKWIRTNYILESSQVRDELKIMYNSESFNLVSGLEARYSEIQENYVSKVEDIKNEPVHNNLDIGIYAQGNYKYKDFKTVLGGRLDYNKIDNDGGYGVVFNPRVALVYTPKNWVYKAIYSEAFKDATNYDRYSVIPGIRDVPNPTLPPEKVKNGEASVSWGNKNSKNEGIKFFIEGSGYYTSYSGVIETVRNSDGLLQNQNKGALQIMGAQLISSLDLNDNLYFQFNYTFTSPQKIPFDETSNELLKDSKIRIGDIATHKFNIITNWKFFKFMINDNDDHHFNWNNRFNFSGKRLTGKNTSVSTNPLSQIDPFFIINSNISYRIKFGLTFGIGVNNVLNTSWFVPGARSASGSYASQIPQEGRNYIFSVRYDIL